MNIKLRISEVVRLINNHVSMELVCKQLIPLAKQVKIGFPAPQIGAGYLQWSLQGDEWISFSEANAEQKAAVAQLYHERSECMMEILKASPLKEVVLTVPSEDFIYFRQNGLDYDISLVAWGYKYPNQSPCVELSTWINKMALQKVCIGFKWDDKLLADYDFNLANFKRKTSNDGLFYVDGLLPVGREYQVRTNSDILFTLKVDQGKEEYIFDLTQYIYVDITVQKDNAAMANCACEVNFNGIQHQLETNGAGCVSLKLPLVCTPVGELLQPQSFCQVICQSEVQEQTPSCDGERCLFAFSFHSEIIQPLQTELPTPPTLKPTPELTPIPEPTPVSPISPLVKPEPKFVEIKLLDYGGNPMADLDFTLVTKRKGNVRLKTDSNGVCSISQEWFTKKEKFQVKVEISSEYQETHDLHDIKNTKN